MAALPRLEDYLPEELDFPGEMPAESEISAAIEAAERALDSQERKLLKVERSAAALKNAFDRFVDIVEDRLPQCEEADIAAAVRDFVGQETGNRAYLRGALAGAEKRRKNALRWRDNDLKSRYLAMTEREIGAIRAALESFDFAKHRLLNMRDRVLIREAQEMSVSFWDGDEPAP